MDHEPRTPSLDLLSVAATLGLPAAAVEALATGGYLASRRDSGGQVRFAPTDVKAFLARNADNGSGAGLLDQVLRPVQPAPDRTGPAQDDMQPEELLGLLDERAEQMARRVLRMVVTIYPEAAAWTDRQKWRFVQRTKSRFEAVLAVIALGTSAEESLFEDLKEIGASAARSSTDLRELLVLLRMSRDLVVQNAVELADTGSRPSGYALSLLLTRILPAMDRIGDAITSGYWEALSAS